MHSTIKILLLGLFKLKSWLLEVLERKQRSAIQPPGKHMLASQISKSARVTELILDHCAWLAESQSLLWKVGWVWIGIFVSEAQYMFGFQPCSVSRGAVSYNRKNRKWLDYKVTWPCLRLSTSLPLPASSRLNEKVLDVETYCGLLSGKFLLLPPCCGRQVGPGGP